MDVLDSNNENVIDKELKPLKTFSTMKKSSFEGLNANIDYLWLINGLIMKSSYTYIYLFKCHTVGKYLYKNILNT